MCGTIGNSVRLVQGGVECTQGPTRWEGKACFHPLPTWLAELNGVELGGGESHPRMVPGGECHQKEASGTRARKGIQDNLKSDSQGNRPALSWLTRPLAIPSTGVHSQGAGVGMTLDYR